MNWDDVSDFEVNRAVANTRGLFWHCKPSSLQNEECVWIYSDNYCDCDTENGSVAVELPDYCNSWTDMGAIIYQHSISLVLDGDYNTAVKNFECFNGEGGGFTGDYEYDHTNPLRAAAIVYLMMNGVKPEDCK